MCSIAIPSELLLGHSPPVYGSLLYNSLMVTTPPLANRSVSPHRCLSSAAPFQLVGLLKTNNNSNSSSGGSSDANKRNKKRVVFADDRGRPLTQVRVMSEPSNMPPLLSSAYVANLSRGTFYRNLDGKLVIPQEQESAAAVPTEGRAPLKCVDTNPWEPSFAQPASEYLSFRNKLDENSVSLENVIVRESENCLLGTVKVKNLAFDKDVAIRMTTDNWSSQQDVACSYVEQPSLAVRNLYDTFRFQLPLPDKDSSQVEFCVKYTSGGQEYWDNNAGANYVVKKKREVSINRLVIFYAQTPS